MNSTPATGIVLPSLASLQPVDSMSLHSSTFRQYLNSARDTLATQDTTHHSQQKPSTSRRRDSKHTPSVKAKLMHFKLATPEQIISCNPSVHASNGALPAFKSPSNRTMGELSKSLVSSPVEQSAQNEVIAQKLESRFSLNQRDISRQTIGNYLADRA